MDIKKIAIEKLKPAAYNPRKKLQPADPEYQKIKRSIQEFGYVDPIIVNKDFTVIGGHQRLEVLKELGFAAIECVVIDLPKTQEKALNVALNKISGEWDIEKLNELLGDLSKDFDLAVLGFENATEKPNGFLEEEIDLDEYLENLDRTGTVEHPIWVAIRAPIGSQAIMERFLKDMAVADPLIKIEKSYEKKEG